MHNKIEYTVTAVWCDTTSDGSFMDIEIHEGYNDDMPEVVGEPEFRDLVKIESKLIAVSKRIKSYAYGGQAGKWYRGTLAYYEEVEGTKECKRSEQSDPCYIWLSDKAAEHVKDMLPA